MHITDYEFHVFGVDDSELTNLAVEYGMAVSTVKHWIDIEGSNRYMLTEVDGYGVRIPLGATQREAMDTLESLAPEYTIPDIELDLDGDPIDETAMCDAIEVAIIEGGDDTLLTGSWEQLANDIFADIIELRGLRTNTVEHSEIDDN